MKKLVSLVAVAFAIGVSSASAQGPGPVGDFDDWSVFTATESGKRICYMASAPEKSEGDYTKRGDVYAMITHRPAENLLDEVSFAAGYTYRQGSEVEVSIGSATFRLFTSEDRAWTFDRKDDKALVAAMRGGARMVVKGTSSRGTATTDTYSLKGFTAAHRAMNTACGVK